MCDSVLKKDQKAAILNREIAFEDITRCEKRKRRVRLSGE